MINPSEMANIARAEQSLWWFRGMREMSFALLDPVVSANRIERALEAGCGTGHFAAGLENRYGFRVCALDLEPEALGYCRQLGLAPCLRSSVACLPFPDGAFDLVTSMDVLVHFPRGQERQPLAELTRVLRPEGWLLVRVAALSIFRSRHSDYVWERQRFSRPQLEALAGGCQLRILRLTYANCLLTPVALLKFRVWEPLTGQPPSSGLAPLPGWLDRLLYWPLALEKHWISRGGGIPWGQSLFLLAQKAPGHLARMVP